MPRNALQNLDNFVARTLLNCLKTIKFCICPKFIENVYFRKPLPTGLVNALNAFRFNLLRLLQLDFNPNIGIHVKCLTVSIYKDSN